jgi:hypothetical protein
VDALKPTGDDQQTPERISLSLCMIARNEERDLARCLVSVKDVVDEIVLVDTGSTDRTPEMALAHGARVICHTWTDDFAAARNAALDHAGGDWILVLDADEELAPDDRSALRRLLLDAPWDGARLRIRNLQPPDDLFRSQESLLLRLFRNRPMYRYTGIVHEQIAPAIRRAGGNVGDAEITIIHHGYARRTAQGGVERAGRNLRLLERALAMAPNDPYLQYQYGATLKMAGMRAGARQALERALWSGASELSSEVVDLIHMKLAQLALADGRLGEAATHARASLAACPDNAVSLLVLALALIFAGNVVAAYPMLQRVRSLANTHLTEVARVDAILASYRGQRSCCHTEAHDGAVVEG